MKRISVRSSNVAKVGYDPETLTLEVEFKDGGLYEFYGVPERHFLNLTSGTRSVGRYMAENIRGHYRYRKLRIRA
jgi:hypothetical protein